MNDAREGELRTAVLAAMVRLARKGVSSPTARQIAIESGRNKVSVHRALLSLKDRGIVDAFGPERIASTGTGPGRPPGTWRLLEGFENVAVEVNISLAVTNEALGLIARNMRLLGPAATALLKARILLEARHPDSIEAIDYPTPADVELIGATSRKLSELVNRFGLSEFDEESRNPFSTGGA